MSGLCSAARFSSLRRSSSAVFPRRQVLARERVAAGAEGAEGRRGVTVPRGSAAGVEPRDQGRAGPADHAQESRDVPPRRALADVAEQARSGRRARNRGDDRQARADRRPERRRAPVLAVTDAAARGDPLDQSLLLNVSTLTRQALIRASAAAPVPHRDPLSELAVEGLPAERANGGHSSLRWCPCVVAGMLPPCASAGMRRTRCVSAGAGCGL